MVLAKGVEGDRTLDDLAYRTVRTAPALGGERGKELGVTFISNCGIK